MRHTVKRVDRKKKHTNKQEGWRDGFEVIIDCSCRWRQVRVPAPTAVCDTNKIARTRAERRVQASMRPGFSSLGCPSERGQRAHPWVDPLCLPQQGSQRRRIPPARLWAVPSQIVPGEAGSGGIRRGRCCLVEEQARLGEHGPEGGAREPGAALQWPLPFRAAFAGAGGPAGRH